VTLFARVVFIVLVGATFSAFFAAQRLKGAPPVVRVTKMTKFFSPNGDGVRDRNDIHVSVKQRDDVTVSVVDRDGGEVRRLVSNVPAQPFRPLDVSWDGRTDEGGTAPDGSYRLRIALRREGRSVTVQRQMVVDTTPPKPVIARVVPAVAGSEPAPFAMIVRHVSRYKPTQFRVLRTDSGAPTRPETTRPREIARFEAPGATRRVSWTPSDPLAPGTYMVVASVTDRAGNVGASVSLPPQAGEISGQPGFTVRALAAQAPDDPVIAGQRIEFFVDSRGRDYRWRVRRVGAPRPVKRGTAKPGAPLVMRAPNGISGVYLLELRHGTDTARVPFLVQSQQRARILVVVPAITWYGTDQVDDDRDGLPNTLASRGPVDHPRVLQGGPDQLPAGFADQVAPLLVYLDRNHLRYDLTSDLSLALDPRASDRDGVLLAGPLRWIPARQARRLRRYVLDGGRLASFGTDTLRRSVSVTRTRLLRPTQPTPTDPFGARLAPLRRGSAAVPLTVLDQRPEEPLLAGSDGSLGGFDVFEESAARPDDARARVLAALGQEPTDEQRARAESEGKSPPEALAALTLSRFGKGTVIRIGLPQWGGRIGKDPEVAQITHNIVDILRGVTPRTRSVRW
jgi:hypothetical protein